MARGTLTPQQFTYTGLKPTYTAGNVDGHMFDNDGQVFLHVVNASGGQITVTIQTPKAHGALAVSERTVTVDDGVTNGKLIGPFPPDVYNRLPGATDAGKVYVDLSAVTSVTIAALRWS